MNLENKTIGNYRIIKQIGLGSFSSVWVAEHVVLHEIVACKVVNKSTLSEGNPIIRFQREIAIHKQINHPFLARFYEFIEEEDNYYLLMEYAENGNMLGYLNNVGRLTETQARIFLMQLVSAIEYLHKEKNIIHRDLKAENVLLDKYDNIRVIDFGLSNVFSASAPSLHSSCGSPAYAAPEMIRGQHYTAAVDIWSIGVLLYALVTGNLPFEDSNIRKVLHKVTHVEPMYPSYLTPNLVDLLQRLLNKNQQTRITIDGIKQHPWFLQGGLYQIDKRLKENPLFNFTFEHITLDHSIVSSLEHQGFDCSLLKESMQTNEHDPTSAAYRILIHKKQTIQLAELVKELIKQQSSDKEGVNSVQFQSLPKAATSNPVHVNLMQSNDFNKKQMPTRQLTVPTPLPIATKRLSQQMVNKRPNFSSTSARRTSTPNL